MRPGLVTLCLMLAGCGSSEEAPPSAPAPSIEASDPAEPPEIERPYEEGVDAQAQIEAALASAREGDKRVLLMFGANWCEWCRRLDYVFQHETRVRAALDEGWVLVHVDVGARGSDTNREIAARYGDPAQHGLPCLVVLDDEGGVAHVQETGSLEDGPRHDPERVLAFLARHRS